MRCLPLRIGAVVLVGLCASVRDTRAQASPQAHEPAAASAVRIHTDGTVSIDGEGVTVRELLDAFHPACAPDLRIDPKLAARVVSIHVTALSAVKAAAAVLEGAGLDFVISAGCSAPDRAMRIVAVERGTAVTGPPAADPDDPRIKEGLEFVSVAPGPAPEPEVRGDTPDATVSTASSVTTTGAQVRAPGEMTGAQLARMLAPKPRSTSTLVELPFTDENSQPYVQVRPPGRRTVATLPFPDGNGMPIDVVIPHGYRPHNINIPRGGQETPGSPAAQPAGSAPSPNPSDAVRPPGGGSER